MTLHGLLRHLTGVERWWFQINFAGQDVPMLYYTDDDPDLDFEGLDGDVDAEWAQWHEEVARARGSSTSMRWTHAALACATVRPSRCARCWSR